MTLQTLECPQSMNAHFDFAKPSSPCSLWHMLRSANFSLATAVEARAAKLNLDPAKVLACANSRGMAVDRVFEALELPALLEQLVAAQRTGLTNPAAKEAYALALERVRGTVQKFATSSRTRPSAESMPVGVTRLPPQRSADFDLTQMRPDTIIDAQATLETNSDPVSNPSFERPADPLFATWMKAYEQLGTRSLTMGEMAGLNDSDINWSGKDTGLRDRGNFKLRLLANEGRMEKHELHKYVGGFRGQPSVDASTINAGRGGENSLFARMTDVYNDHDLPTRWGEESVIRDYWMEHRPPPRPKNNTQPDKWALDAQKLTSASREALLVEVRRYHDNGYYADPREQQKLTPSTQALLASAPGSPQRAAAANELTQILRDRANIPDVTSVSGATADIQMTETLYRYMRENKLDFARPNDQIDVVEVYNLYRRLLSAGELTSRATVEGWLKDWNVPHVP
jgi:hypothetical protein